jgi:HTH-type transcriptional regulator/antitoxin HipB
MIVSNARDLGLLVRHRRDTLGLTPADVAQRAGVSRQWLIHVEQGKGTSEVDRVLRLLRVLGLRTDIRANREQMTDG